MGGTDYHRVITMIDPMTGLPRLIFGNDQGVWSVLDNNGTFEIAGRHLDQLPGHRPQRQPPDHPVLLRRGPAQQRRRPDRRRPVLRQAQDNGGPASAPEHPHHRQHPLVRPRRRRHRRRHRPAGARAPSTSTTGPAAAASYTDFFQVNGVGAGPIGLLQAEQAACPPPTRSGRFTGGANFAVNPVNGQRVIISSASAGSSPRPTRAMNWFDIGDPAVFGNPGGFSVALAYGAPDPNAPDGHRQPGQLHLRRHRSRPDLHHPGRRRQRHRQQLAQHLAGPRRLAGPVDRHRPHRGSHDGLRRHHQRRLLHQGLGPPRQRSHQRPPWVNITGNIHNLPYTIFGQSYNPTTDPNAIKLNQAQSLNVDRGRLAVHDPQQRHRPQRPGFHPVLYVGFGGNGSGVYRSIDNGLTWSLFPTTTFGAVAQGGNLPHATVTDLDLSLGNIDANTGMPNLAGPYDPNNADRRPPDPDVLLATTYGRGSFAIKLAPLVFPSTVQVDSTRTAPDGTPLVTTTTPTFSGLSSITAFGNATRITIMDVSDPDPTKWNHRRLRSQPSVRDQHRGQLDRRLRQLQDHGKRSHDGQGPRFATNGLKTVQIYATDDAGAVGNVVTLTFTLNAKGFPPLPPTSPPTIVTLALRPSEAVVVGTPPVTYTKSSTPDFDGVTDTNTASVELWQVVGGAPTTKLATTTTIDPVTGAFTLKLPSQSGRHLHRPRPGNQRQGPPGQLTRHVHDQDARAQPRRQPVPRARPMIRGSSATTSPTCASRTSPGQLAPPMPPAR